MTRQPTTDHGVLEETRLKTRKPTRFKVILLNDDYTTMEFVVQVHDAGTHRGPWDLRRV